MHDVGIPLSTSESHVIWSRVFLVMTAKLPIPSCIPCSTARLNHGVIVDYLDRLHDSTLKPLKCEPPEEAPVDNAALRAAVHNVSNIADWLRPSPKDSAGISHVCYYFGSAVQGVPNLWCMKGRSDGLHPSRVR